jgi:ribose/xylose/arabinose/galactoside ABC-type transport system permease subunit
MNLRWRAARAFSTTGVPMAVALVIVVLIFQAMSPVFLEPSSIRDYVNNAIPILLITVGVGIVMVGGGIDLSIGTVAGLSAGTTMWALSAGLPTAVAVLVGVATGTFFGAVNGFFITVFGINDFIVTLATLNVAGGLLIVLTEAVSLRGIETRVGLGRLVYGSFLGVPISFWIAAGTFILMQFMLMKTIFGRRVFAVGIGAEAADIAGVNVNRVRLATFVISGALAGGAGVLLASRFGSVQAFLGLGYEFTAIAGAVLGGISLAGGRGSVWAAVVGGLMLASLQQGLRLNGVDPVYFSIVTGLCIVAGVVFDRGAQKLALTSIASRVSADADDARRTSKLEPMSGRG